MIALTAPGTAAHAVLFLTAFALLVLAAVLGALEHQVPFACAAAGLAAWMLILAWTALAAT